MRDDIRIAVTSVGSGIGQSIVNSCRLSHLPIVLVGLDVNAMAYGAYDCDIQRLVPPYVSPDYLETVLDICVAEKIGLLIPGLDGELPLISKHIDMFLEKGIKVLIAGHDFVNLCRGLGDVHKKVGNSRTEAQGWGLGGGRTQESGIRGRRSDVRGLKTIRRLRRFAQMRNGAMELIS